jgi:hypothetical protein
MKARQIIAIVLAVIALPVLFLGLIDPLEGGIALLVGVALVVAVRLISGVAVPKITWIPMSVAIAVGLLILSIVIFANPGSPGGGDVPNPINGAVIALLWAYRAIVLVALAGAVVYVVRLIRGLRAADQPQESVATK